MGQAVALQNRSRIAAPAFATPQPSSAAAPQAASYQALWSAPRTVRSTLPPSLPTVLPRTARPREERLMLQVALDDKFLATFRRALFSASEGLITLLRVQPDPRDAHRVKVWLGMSRPAVRAVIDLIIATLPEAEIGRIAPV